MKQYTFSYEHIDGHHGYYIRADSRDEADKLFTETCTEQKLDEEDYHLSRIQEGDSDGPWLWDLYTGQPMPDDLKRREPRR
jgi:hypothetical protein